MPHYIKDSQGHIVPLINPKTKLPVQVTIQVNMLLYYRGLHYMRALGDPIATLWEYAYYNRQQMPLLLKQLQARR